MIFLAVLARVAIQSVSAPLNVTIQTDDIPHFWHVYETLPVELSTITLAIIGDVFFFA